METIRNLFHNIPAHAPDEIFETILQSPHVRIERIVSTGQSTPEGEWYDQEQHEWILLVQGHAALRFEEEPEERVLVAGNCLNIAAHVRHRVTWTSRDEPTVWLAVFYD
jgi:cupin 2 domain-containing protein